MIFLYKNVEKWKPVNLLTVIWTIDTMRLVKNKNDLKK